MKKNTVNSTLTNNEKNDIACEFMAKFGGLHNNKINKDVKADEVMKWVINQIEHYTIKTKQ